MGAGLISRRRSPSCRRGAQRRTASRSIAPDRNRAGPLWRSAEGSGPGGSRLFDDGVTSIRPIISLAPGGTPDFRECNCGQGSAYPQRDPSLRTKGGAAIHVVPSRRTDSCTILMLSCFRACCLFSADGNGASGSGFVSPLALSGSFPGGASQGDGQVLITTSAA